MLPTSNNINERPPRKPNALSVTVQRIGYITIANGADSYYKDSAQTGNSLATRLDNYKDGFSA